MLEIEKLNRNWNRLRIFCQSIPTINDNVTFLNVFEYCGFPGSNGKLSLRSLFQPEDQHPTGEETYSVRVDETSMSLEQKWSQLLSEEQGWEVKPDCADNEAFSEKLTDNIREVIRLPNEK